MKRLLFFCSLLLFGFALSAQTSPSTSQDDNTKHSPNWHKADTAKVAPVSKPSLAGLQLVRDTDTLSQSDFMMSIERVNENLNSIRDSASLNFETIKLERRINEITGDILLIRQNMRDRRSAVNIKSIYLYLSFATSLNEDNTLIRSHVARLYNRTFRAKQHMSTILSDSVFRILVTSGNIPAAMNKKLNRLNRKWARTDSTIRANIDTLNAMQVSTADNALSLSNMLNLMDKKLDRARPQLFGKEAAYLWQLQKPSAAAGDTTKTMNILSSENKAIGYYLDQTTGKREFIFFLGILVFVWLFFKRKLLRKFREHNESVDFMRLHYLNDRPILSLLILLLCLMPFFDAYAPTSYTAIVFSLLLAAATVLFVKKTGKSFHFYWIALVILFAADITTYLLIEPAWIARVWMMSVHLVIFVFTLRFYRQLNAQMPYYKWIRPALFTGMILLVLAVASNILGRFSLSGFLGLAATVAITQVLILPVFIDTAIEIILLQLLGSRLKKGIETPFDVSVVTIRVQKLLLWVAMILWLIMLTSNLNIYSAISTMIADFLTATRSIGSISFEFVSVLLFFAIIWSAHMLQRLIIFFFGETGSQAEDTTTMSKGQHSRLLITRLLVLIGGYMLAIAASGLPIDKLTFLLGALGVGIGMGLSGIVNNFVSGIILVFDGSLQIGDEIEVSGQSGRVKEIGMRASTLYTSEGAEVTIPNGTILSQNIVNWTFSNDQKRLSITFALAGKDLDANVVNEVINSTLKTIPAVVSERVPVIIYTRVTPATLSITVRFWSTVNNVDQVKSEAMLKLSAAFTAKNIGFE